MAKTQKLRESKRIKNLIKAKGSIFTYILTLSQKCLSFDKQELRKFFKVDRDVCRSFSTKEQKYIFLESVRFKI